MQKRNWTIYIVEFLSVFIAVISAFALNNWNDNRKERHIERNILQEVRNGLQKDTADINLNILGHREGVRACKYLRKLITGDEVDQDSFLYYFVNVTRDFVTIQNRSGYESLKSKGLELISNDSLRFEIISFYEYDFYTLQILEEEYAEMQYYESFSDEIERVLTPFMQFDENGNPVLKGSVQLSEKDKQLLLTSLWRIQYNRRFILQFYNGLEEKIERLVEAIDEEVGS